MGTLEKYSRFVALPHSVFALPFALTSFLLAVKTNHEDGIAGPTLVTLFWIVVAVVSARTAAMAFNRYADAAIDAKNPRTAGREIPSNQISLVNAQRLVVGSSLMFLVASYILGVHCLVLAPVVLGILFGYSYTKRFTNYSHLFLGLALACAPGGAWWVVRPQVEPTPLLIMAAVLLWVSGFDILYSCQDAEFDRANGLHSIPSRWGIDRALMVAKGFHVVAIFLFFCVGISANLTIAYFVGMSLLGILLLCQHALISPTNLNRINHSFFTVNGMVSVCYLALVATLL